jgi:hypothetical protein
LYKKGKFRLIFTFLMFNRIVIAGNEAIGDDFEEMLG